MGINSHIQLPAFIIRQFRDGNDPEKKVWYLDLKTGQIRKKAAKNLGTSKGYYSENIEAFWNQSVETPFGKLSEKVRKFCNDEEDHITITKEEIDLIKHYVKAAAVRSSFAYMAMMQRSFTAHHVSEQQNHDALSLFGMNLKAPEEFLVSDYSVAILINQTERQMVVPRNCFYCVSSLGMYNLVLPISPKSALLLLPTEYPMLKNGYVAVVDDSEQIVRMNEIALQYEYYFNLDFVASGSREELEYLKKYLENNLDYFQGLVDHSFW